MDPTVNALVNLFLRWIHIVAGILWIGHLYFFNFVNAQFQAKVEGPTASRISSSRRLNCMGHLPVGQNVKHFESVISNVRWRIHP